jgi:type VI secretion system secreted protein Hcp
MAVEFFATVTGSKQGVFKPEGPPSGPGKGKIRGVAFTYAVNSPRDPATGLPTGKRQHQPVTFTKEWGASSPQFYQSAFTNETLTTVLFEFYATQVDGKTVVDHTIKLTDVTIASVGQSLHEGQAGGPLVDSGDLQTIAFVFQKIEITNLLAGTQASDDWEARV